MQTISIQVPDSLYNQLIASGIDIKEKMQESLYDFLDDGYPSISTAEAKKRVADAVERYESGTEDYIGSEDYQVHIAQTMDNLKRKYANN